MSERFDDHLRLREQKKYEDEILDQVADWLEEKNPSSSKSSSFPPPKNKYFIDSGDLCKELKLLMGDLKIVKMKDVHRYRMRLDPKNTGKIEFYRLLELVSKEVEEIERENVCKSLDSSEIEE